MEQLVAEGGGFRCAQDCGGSMHPISSDSIIYRTAKLARSLADQFIHSVVSEHFSR